MASATVSGATTNFTYRGDGLRDSRTVGMNTTTFTWDINAGLPVVLDDGNQYVYGAGLESMVTGTGSYYYLADGLGSTMAVVDSAGAVQKSYTYNVYGEAAATGSLANEFDFAGQQTDSSTGLQYLRARYMDPETGSFLSRDPLASLATWSGSPMGYGGGTPALRADPSGLMPGPVCGDGHEPGMDSRDTGPAGCRPAHSGDGWGEMEGPDIVGAVVASLVSYLNRVGASEMGRVEQGKLTLESLPLIDKCAQDMICSMNVSATLHVIGKFVPWVETTAVAWDDYSQGRQDLPGIYPTPEPPNTVPASPDMDMSLTGESNC